MQMPKKKIDRVSIEWATNRNKDYAEALIDRVEKFKTEKAGINGQCKYCSYLSPDRIGGAAMTYQPCGICETDMMFSSTCTDVLCASCATKNELCKKCGGDIDMKIKRKPRAFQIA